MIARALDHPRPKEALVDALRKIEKQGREPEYEADYRMFTSFMAQIIENWDFQNRLTVETATALMEDIILQLSAEILANPAIQMKTHPEWTELPPRWVEDLTRRVQPLVSMAPGISDPELDVVRDEQTVASIVLSPLEPTHRISDIQPGTYTFALDSGRLLWSGIITEHELILSEALPGENFKMAADSGEPTTRPPSRKITLLEGDLVIQVYPGVESGWIEIKTRNLR